VTKPYRSKKTIVKERPRSPESERTDSIDSYLVSYDIANPKRLRKVARACEDFGLRRQYSVFFCRLTAADVVRLKSRLYDEIDLAKDRCSSSPSASVASPRSRRWGGGRGVRRADVIIVS